jgi:glycosyltransferase involved in cell wall biosynthesis
VKQGVNIYGYVYAESGVGQLTRLLIETLQGTGFPYAVVPFTTTLSRQETFFNDLGVGDPVFDINIIGVNADQVPVFVEHFGPSCLDGRYSIGIWAWEIEEFPDWMARSSAYLDEIWGISTFTAEAIASKVDVPVHPFTLPIKAPAPLTMSRHELGLPESFLFLYCFDFDSVFARKNPIAVIDAFIDAFPEPAGAHLCIKSINGDRHPEHVRAVRSASERRIDITYRDGYSTAEEQSALMKSCDAYISLHRAEGYGLTMAEAMALGKPVIATGYSGNLDFMNEENSYLVPFKYSLIGPGSNPYPPDSMWAEPDVKAASGLIRRVIENPDEARLKAGRARRNVIEFHSPAVRSGFVIDRISRARRGLHS